MVKEHVEPDWSIVVMKASDWSIVIIKASDWSIVVMKAFDWSIVTYVLLEPSLWKLAVLSAINLPLCLSWILTV